MEDSLQSRYRRQARFLGSDAQERIRSSKIAMVGCGAIGGMSASLLARAGVGQIQLIDRDLVEDHNLHRQDLFDEADVEESLPKAVAAVTRIREINSQVESTAIVQNLSSRNISELLGGMDVIVDGVDNFAARYLINDFCWREGIPWVSAGCLGAAGQVMSFLPGQSRCLRCILPEPPPAASVPTCETVGVIGPIVSVIAGFQAAETLKILAGAIDLIRPGLLSINVWTNEIRSLTLTSADQTLDNAADHSATGSTIKNRCPCCGERRFEFLDRPETETQAVLCGQDSVQIVPGESQNRFHLKNLADRLASIGLVKSTAYLVKFQTEETSMTLFADGRAIVHGVRDLGRAQSLYDRYIGR